jgi:hypothetical protein
MPTARPPRRVLVVAGRQPEFPLEQLFAAPPLAGWEAICADDFAAARFVLQHGPCDALLVDEPSYRRDGPAALDWLANRHGLPAVVLGRPEVDAGPTADEPLRVWLPAGGSVLDAAALAAALDQAARFAELQRDRRRLGETLRQSRRQVDRLLHLLWRTLPLDVNRRWLGQRHALERLREETDRTRRYGSPLTVALGEVEMPDRAPQTPLPDWAAERIVRSKRSCDVAGQYGPHGFVLLLVNTPLEGGAACCRRLQRLLEETGEPLPPPRAYFGLAAASGETPTPQALLRRAEDALEAAKAKEQERLVCGEG